jgi:hypothetical protein
MQILCCCAMIQLASVSRSGCRNTGKNHSGHFEHSPQRQCVLRRSTWTNCGDSQIIWALPSTAGAFQRWEHHTLDTRGLWPDVGDIGCDLLIGSFQLSLSKFC